MARSSFAVAGVLTLGASLAGCYTLQPARGATPVVGEKVAFDVNDAGRVALGGSLGPEIAQIEGRVVGHDSGEYVLAVNEKNVVEYRPVELGRRVGDMRVVNEGITTSDWIVAVGSVWRACSRSCVA